MITFKSLSKNPGAIHQAHTAHHRREKQPPRVEGHHDSYIFPSRPVVVDSVVVQDPLPRVPGNLVFEIGKRAADARVAPFQLVEVPTLPLFQCCLLLN